MAVTVDASIEQKASLLHQRAVVVDALGWALVERASALTDGKDQIDRSIDAGLTISHQYLAGSYLVGPDEAMHKFWRYYGLAEIHATKVLIVETAADIERAKRERKLGLILGFQGASPLEHDLAYMTIFHKLGLRIMGIAYDHRNRLGSGCREPQDLGLTALGEIAVKEANRLGILIDGSHAGEKTTLDAFRISSKPVVFTHSNVRAVCPNPRNLSDAQIDAVGASGGVIGLSTHAAFSRRQPSGPATIDDLIAHLEYIVERIGIDHVGIGTDMVSTETLTEQIQSVTMARMIAPGFFRNVTGVDRFVRDFDSVSGFRNLTRALVARGYADEDVLKILGGNWVRVFNQVWGG